MKLLLDQGLPRSAGVLLCNVGIETIHVSEIGLSVAEDAVIATHVGWVEARNPTPTIPVNVGFRSALPNLRICRILFSNRLSDSLSYQTQLYRNPVL
ncbi:hypothetical protein DP116_18115 [Brasilonema bromeliae SPC951]|uniref:DUF5615 domain-containing protein n=2 Tax=Bromeliae group (in: Brasilonema) TaxID=3398495 RepID=A0ABX1PA85_9CYAN|nr:hypothetical protein [Brasilonema bromeliae SPC951]